nr:hypothetical protein I308_04782 [Cryptococcus tetragattii IND107]
MLSGSPLTKPQLVKLVILIRRSLITEFAQPTRLCVVNVSRNRGEQ